MSAAYYKASFGGLRLWMSKISTDKSRTQVVHDPSAGDQHTVQDRGRVALRTTATLLFDYMIGDNLEPIDRLQTFKSLIDDKSRMLTHPIEGSFQARVGAFNYDIDENGVISAEVGFTAVSDIQPVSLAGAGGIPASGDGAVQAAADTLTAELAAIGQTSTLPQEAAEASDAWNAADDINPRDVLAQTGSLTSQLGTLATAFQDSADTWAAFKATVLLSDAVLAAALAVTADTSQTFSLLVGTTIALRALVASIYGADEADQRYQQAMALNDIPSPAWLEPGTQLTLPTPTARARAA